jgi:serine/threonine-protein kinase RsbW
MFHPSRGSNPAPTRTHSEPWRSVNGRAVPAAGAPWPATTLRSSISYPAVASQITQARRFLAGFLAGLPLADDAVLCLSEVATNSVIHSNSGRIGGHFTVTAERHDDGRVRFEVEDEGGAWIEREKSEGQPSLGLLIVGQLAREWGIKQGNRGTRAVWFEVGPGQHPVQPVA